MIRSDSDPHDIPGFGRLGRIDDPVPDREYGDRDPDVERYVVHEAYCLECGWRVARDDPDEAAADERAHAELRGHETSVEWHIVEEDHR